MIPILLVLRQPVSVRPSRGARPAAKRKGLLRVHHRVRPLLLAVNHSLNVCSPRFSAERGSLEGDAGTFVCANCRAILFLDYSEQAPE